MSTKKEISIFIKEGLEEAEGKVTSTVAIRFVNCDGIYEGDYKKFDVPELTDEQILGAVQQLLEKFLPVIPKVEEHFSHSSANESLGVFKIGPNREIVRI